jgi:hypothetical protein
MKHVRSVLLSAVVVLIAGLLSACGGSDFGVASGAPLGSAATIESKLAAKGLTKHDVSVDEVRPYLPPDLAADESLAIVEFRDQVANYKHAVLLVRKGGDLQAGVCVFRSGSFVFSKVGTKAETFRATYWADVSGSSAEFKKENDRSLGMREYMFAEFKQGGAKGYWRKDSQDETMRNPQGVVDNVWVRRP